MILHFDFLSFDLSLDVFTDITGICVRIKECVFSVVVISALRERSLVKKSFSDLNVSLFNMHSTRLADSLIKRDVGSLCLVEASQNNARLMKVIPYSTSHISVFLLFVTSSWFIQLRSGDYR